MNLSKLCLKLMAGVLIVAGMKTAFAFSNEIQLNLETDRRTIEIISKKLGYFTDIFLYADFPRLKLIVLNKYCDEDKFCDTYFLMNKDIKFIGKISNISYYNYGCIFDKLFFDEFVLTARSKDSYYAIHINRKNEGAAFFVRSINIDACRK